MVEGVLAFDRKEALAHAGVAVAAELGAVDLVAALFDGGEPDRDAHPGGRVVPVLAGHVQLVELGIESVPDHPPFLDGGGHVVAEGAGQEVDELAEAVEIVHFAEAGPVDETTPVDIAFVEKLPRAVPLSELKADPALEEMLVTGKSRLSVQPVEQPHFDRVVGLAREEEA